MASTQNIDTLEQVAHIEKVTQCHGEYTEHRHLRTGGCEKGARYKYCRTAPCSVRFHGYWLLIFDLQVPSPQRRVWSASTKQTRKVSRRTLWTRYVTKAGEVTGMIIRFRNFRYGSWLSSTLYDVTYGFMTHFLVLHPLDIQSAVLYRSCRDVLTVRRTSPSASWNQISSSLESHFRKSSTDRWSWTRTSATCSSSWGHRSKCVPSLSYPVSIWSRRAHTQWVSGPVALIPSEYLVPSRSCPVSIWFHHAHTQWVSGPIALIPSKYLVPSRSYPVSIWSHCAHTQ